MRDVSGPECGLSVGRFLRRGPPIWGCNACPWAVMPCVSGRDPARGTALRADLVRKALQRSHARFAELLVDEVAASLADPTHDELALELSELDLLKYCRSVLERRPT